MKGPPWAALNFFAFILVVSKIRAPTAIMALGLTLGWKLVFVTREFSVFFRYLAGLLRMERIPAFFKHEIKHIPTGVMGFVQDVQNILE